LLGTKGLIRHGVSVAGGTAAFYALAQCLIWPEFCRYAKKANQHPVPDCPAKREIEARFAEHGYGSDFREGIFG